MNHFLSARRKVHQVAEGAWFQKKPTNGNVEIVLFAENDTEREKNPKKPPNPNLETTATNQPTNPNLLSPSKKKPKTKSNKTKQNKSQEFAWLIVAFIFTLQSVGHFGG